ncbi:MAG: 16S rRNA (uracil(1498)-N(3))-methyltransferase [Helicobacteraceae bacterium]|jgi:16S rRNA (uracil1498-N3)-methyltransferase|nr:16S rRNA (uracil(1498)-N(3))-methyltransferase [Helicobacteraceae bacterium]
MRFLYSENAGEDDLALSGDRFARLKVRRVRVGETVKIRNLQDDNLYDYSVRDLGKSKAILSLTKAALAPVLPARDIAVAWCVVDPKTIDKTLPALNEMGAGKLTLIWSEKSQRDFHLNLDRFDRIIIGSCEQCGRSRKMTIEIKELSVFASENANAAVLDFGGAKLTHESMRDYVVIVGPEGGFGDGDYETLKNPPRFSVDTPLTLRSETAILLIASLAAACSPRR